MFTVTTPSGHRISCANSYAENEVTIRIAEGETYKNYKGSLVIPAYVYNNGVKYKVTRIGTRGFMYADISSVVIPNTVVALYSNAFRLCINLKTVTFDTGSELESIGDWAFAGCVNLESIALPSTLKQIGKSCFRVCSKMQSIILPNRICNVPQSSFSYCRNLSSVNYLCQGAIVIEDSAFVGCDKLNRPSGSRFTIRPTAFENNRQVVQNSSSSSSRPLSPQSTPQRTSKNNSSVSQKPKTTKTSTPDGGYTEITTYPDGKIEMVIKQPCKSCNRTGICPNCHGSGIQCYIAGRMIRCACGNGRHGFCGGTGWMTFKNTSYANGQVSGSTSWGDTYQGDQNSVQSSNGKTYYSGSNEKEERSGSTTGSKTCTKCGGARYERTRYNSCAASTSGWMQPYHNNVGNKCPICSYNTEHCHYPCIECHGYGRIR